MYFVCVSVFFFFVHHRFFIGFLFLFSLSSESMWIRLTHHQPFGESFILHANTHRSQCDVLYLVCMYVPVWRKCLPDAIFRLAQTQTNKYNTRNYRVEIVTSISVRKCQRHSRLYPKHSWRSAISLDKWLSARSQNESHILTINYSNLE